MPYSYWSSAQRRGYSGTATFLRQQPESVSLGIDIPEFDQEGRFVITEHKDFSLYNIYFPNGAMSEIRHQFKMDFLRKLNLHLAERIKKGRQIIVLGDYNVAHHEVDVYDPVRLANCSGFLPEERAWMDDFMALGFVDTFRYLNPDVKDRYSWWSYRERARIGNRGWRIDYICVTQGLIERVSQAQVLDQQEGSDHCPISIELADM
jgi:exodeoxyribonuclease-3